MEFTEFAAPTGLNRDGSVSFGATGPEYVEFFTKAVPHPGESEKAGRPIFVNQDFVKVLIPGERDQIVRRVKDEDKRRWAPQWQRYQSNQEQTPEGTPLDVLFPGNPAQVDNLRALKFYTVEQLADASDSALQSIGFGGRDMQAKARRFLEVANKSAQAHAVEKQLAERDDRIRQLETLVYALKSTLEKKDPSINLSDIHVSPPSEPAKRRGRPPKEA